MSFIASPKPRIRLGFVDDARGLAVLIMAFWHAADAWLRPELRAESWYEGMRYVGGLAAPMFLFLAGAGAHLKISGDASRAIPRSQTVRELICRGLEVVIAGYALRVFMWAVDSAAITRWWLWPSWGGQAAGLALLYLACGRFADRRAEARWFALAGLALWSFGMWRTSLVAAHRVLTLGRVDVLQAIGACLVVLALLDAALDLRRRPYLGLVLGFVTTTLTPWIEAQAPFAVHPWLAGYIARGVSDPEPLMALFPLFPWLGYALVGASIGAVWHRFATRDAVDEVVLGLACVGALAGAVFHESLPHMRALLLDHPELLRTSRMFQKIGTGLALTGATYVLIELRGASPLRTLGTTSLFLYCFHLELVYGIVALPLAHALGVAAFVPALLALYVVVALGAEGRTKLPLLLARRRAPSASPRKG